MGEAMNDAMNVNDDGTCSVSTCHAGLNGAFSRLTGDASDVTLCYKNEHGSSRRFDRRAMGRARMSFRRCTLICVKTKRARVTEPDDASVIKANTSIWT